MHGCHAASLPTDASRAVTAAKQGFCKKDQLLPIGAAAAKLGHISLRQPRPAPDSVQAAHIRDLDHERDCDRDRDHDRD